MKGFRQHGDRLEWAGKHETLRIEPWGEDSLRVRATLAPEVRDDLPGAPMERLPGTARIEIGSQLAVVTNGLLSAEVSAEGRVRFVRADDGAELLAEERPHFSRPPARWYRARDGGSYRFEMRLAGHPGERFYALGQHQHGRLDQSGTVIDLVQRNMEVSIPFMLSSRGYGLLWNHPGLGRVELAGARTRWVAESLKQVDYWVTAAPTPARIVERYVSLTGRPPMLPEWASGFWQCKLRYHTQDEVLAVAREYRRRQLPLSVIVVDYFHWLLMGEWRFDPREWPDPTGMVRELRSMGVETMVSIWPTVNPEASTYREMDEQGLLVASASGPPLHLDTWDKGRGQGGRTFVRYYDATNPEARAYLWRRVDEGYRRHDVRAWWLDACEPEVRPESPENLRFHLGGGLEVQNLYPLLHAQGFFEGMRAAGEPEVLLLCRSAWAGSQRYGAAVWSGDVDSSFEALQAQVPAGLNIGLSGIPWWTSDIGGFLGGDIRSDSFRELVVRWFQFGAFCPLFRLHGSREPKPAGVLGPAGAENEAWSFGETAYTIIRDLLWLRERLRPYVMEQMRVAHERGAPPMRPLFYDFPGDATAWEVGDQFLLGPDILVAPVTVEGARRRDVYLPEAACWVDPWTGRSHEGGRSLTADAPLERIPVYVREGSNLERVIRG
jgi:alpha-D-xyloside xylohydrolase